MAKLALGEGKLYKQILQTQQLFPENNTELWNYTN